MYGNTQLFIFHGSEFLALWGTKQILFRRNLSYNLLHTVVQEKMVSCVVDSGCFHNSQWNVVVKSQKAVLLLLANESQYLSCVVVCFWLSHISVPFYAHTPHALVLDLFLSSKLTTLWSWHHF